MWMSSPIVFNKESIKNLSAYFALTFTSLWTKWNSADNKWMIFFLENRLWYFLQTVSLGGNLHVMLKPIFWEKWENDFHAEFFTQHAKN